MYPDEKRIRMDSLEGAIAIYLTMDGKVFIAPQFNIKWEMNEGGSCPDFVALDFSCNEVVVVEVTAAADLKPLAKRIAERESRWFSPIRKRLKEANIITSDWRVRFLGFVRQGADNKISKNFVGLHDVSFAALEDSMIPWIYWENREKNGLPGNGRKADISSN
jgi:hypothetical protein